MEKPWSVPCPGFPCGKPQCVGVVGAEFVRGCGAAGGAGVRPDKVSTEMKRDNLPRYRKAQAQLKEKSSLTPEKHGRVALANLSLFLMLLSGGLLASTLALFAVLLFMGGTELVSEFLVSEFTGSESKGDVQEAIFWVFILTSGPGAVQGVWLWSKVMRKTALISEARVKKMSGF